MSAQSEIHDDVLTGIRREFKQVRTVGRYLKESTFIDKSRRTLLDTQVDLIGADRSDLAREEFPFSFRLPNDLPNSLAHDNGDIFYFVQAVAIIDS